MNSERMKSYSDEVFLSRNTRSTGGLQYRLLLSLSAAMFGGGYVIGTAMALGSPELGEWLLGPISLLLMLVVALHFFMLWQLGARLSDRRSSSWRR